MRIKNIFLGILVCLIFSSCASPQVISTTIPSSPAPIATFTAQPTNTALPENIVEGAFRSGLSPNEIISFFTEIRSYIANNDVKSLAEKVSFPLSECGRNKGDKIEAKEEFTQRFNEFFTDKEKTTLLNAPLEDMVISMYGITIGGIWFSGICDGNNCSKTSIKVMGIGGYCAYRISAPTTTEGATADAAELDYPAEYFVYGVYKLESYEEHGSHTAKNEIEKLKSIDVKIERNNYTTDSGCSFGCSCSSPEYEFNKPFYAYGRALWFGTPAIGELIVICDEKPIAYFDILANDKIGYFYSGYYLTFTATSSSSK